MSRLTLGDFYRDGQWDCGHAIDPSALHEVWVSLGKPTCREAHVNVIRAYEAEDFSDSADWIDQQDEFDGLDPEECWKSWKRGWLDRAASCVQSWIPDWLESDGYCAGCAAKRRRVAGCVYCAE